MSIALLPCRCRQPCSCPPGHPFATPSATLHTFPHTDTGRTRFTSPDDKLVLEDEGARIVLTGPVVPTASLVTGVVASVRGRILPSGEFCVSEICYAELGAQPVAPPPLSLHSPGSGPQVARAPARWDSAGGWWRGQRWCQGARRQLRRWHACGAASPPRRASMPLPTP